MRTSFIVGIFGLALAVAGATEWASRRTLQAELPASRDATTSAKPTSGSAEPANSPQSFPPVSRLSADSPVGVEHVFVLSGRDGGFRVNAISLSEAIIDRIDAEFTEVDPIALASTRFVIEGHTDGLGAKDVNTRIALARALAVREYLKERYEIPVEMMRVVSYGGDRPIADNATADGRALNRRVVIRMLPDAPHD